MRGIAGALLLAGAALLARGTFIHAKAELAQVLLERAFQRARTGETRPAPWPWADTWPVARLRAPGHAADLIVLDGATGRTLAFGPGLLAGSAPPGAPGNTVLAGHRDTHFAFLRALRPGDRLELETPAGPVRRYRVHDAAVVHERRTDLLEPDGVTRLTLITCYPFDSPHVGGPLRFAVRADWIPDPPEPEEHAAAAAAAR